MQHSLPFFCRVIFRVLAQVAVRTRLLDLPRQLAGQLAVERRAVLLEALDEYLAPPEIVIIRDHDAGSWQRELGKLYAPHRLVFSIPANLEGLDAALADKKPGSATRAYVCRGSTCSAPVESLGDLVRTAQARV